MERWRCSSLRFGGFDETALLDAYSPFWLSVKRKIQKTHMISYLTIVDPKGGLSNVMLTSLRLSLSTSYNNDKPFGADFQFFPPRHSLMKMNDIRPTVYTSS